MFVRGTKIEAPLCGYCPTCAAVVLHRHGGSAVCSHRHIFPDGEAIPYVAPALPDGLLPEDAEIVAVDLLGQIEGAKARGADGFATLELRMRLSAIALKMVGEAPTNE